MDHVVRQYGARRDLEGTGVAQSVEQNSPEHGGCVEGRPTRQHVDQGKQHDDGTVPQQTGEQTAVQHQLGLGSRRYLPCDDPACARLVTASRERSIPTLGRHEERFKCASI